MNEYPISQATADEVFSEAIGLSAFSYNDQVTYEVFSVFRLIASANIAICTGDIAERLNMLPSHVELIQYILCNNDHAEYGTSPRCCWLTDKGKNLYKRVAQFGVWEDEPS